MINISGVLCQWIQTVQLFKLINSILITKLNVMNRSNNVFHFLAAVLIYKSSVHLKMNQMDRK